MKVITEERLKEILSSRVYPEWVIEGLIRNELQECGSIREENGQLIVDELRPMSDIPIGENILMKIKLFDGLYATVISEDDDLYGCEGWIPLPIYRPKDGA